MLNALQDTASGSDEDPQKQLIQLFNTVVHDGDFRSVVFSRPRDRTAVELRVDVRAVKLKAGVRFQFARRTKTQEFHSNLTRDEAAKELCRLAEDVFLEARIVTAGSVWTARCGKKGRWQLSQSLQTTAGASLELASNESRQATTEMNASHNKSRQYLIPDGVPCPFLIRTGIMAADGKVRAKHYHKFRQINRYLEFIHDAIRLLDCATASADSNGELTHALLRVVDFGCGKSYLTFATHYLLSTVLNRPCQITGLDRRADVVETCQRISAELDLRGIQFQVGEISGYQPDGDVHLAVSLHACDTATDDALKQAVVWGSQVIMAVPCCQHELASMLNRDSLPLITDHGVFRERFAAMATDTVRAAVLEAMGYDAKLMEFIDMEHTPKNVLIRAVKRPAETSEKSRQLALQKLGEFQDRFNLPALKLEKMLLQTAQNFDGRQRLAALSEVPDARNCQQLSPGTNPAKDVQSLS